jgi:4-alpha-glucanotransferase
VVSPGTHDTSPLRDWWQEDPGVTERYWHAALGRWGDPPASATPEAIEAIIRRHLAGPAMLCIAPLTDMLAMDEDLRRSDGNTERVNDPADRHHRWRHRLHVTVEDLAAAEGFTARLRTLLAETDR